MTLRKAPRLSEKRVNKILAEYDLPGKVRAHLATLGELTWRRPLNNDTAFSTGAEPFRGQTPARYRDYAVLTRRGMLGISVYDDWIPCVFDDAKAGSHVGASVPSGKWNHHAFAEYCHGPTSREEIIGKLDATLARFIAELAWLVDRRFEPETRAASVTP